MPTSLGEVVVQDVAPVEALAVGLVEGHKGRLVHNVQGRLGQLQLRRSHFFKYEYSVLSVSFSWP